MTTQTGQTKPATHTPGPWKFEFEGGRVYWEANRYNRVSIATIDPGAKAYLANARLIAAAPELLEAAKTALDNLSPQYSSEHIVIKQLRAAIAKATERI